MHFRIVYLYICYAFVLDVWMKLCKINEWAKKHKVYDTMFIFYKMKYDHVFEFVAFCKGQEGLEFTQKYVKKFYIYIKKMLYFQKFIGIIL